MTKLSNDPQVSQAFATRMREAGLAEAVLSDFARLYQRYQDGDRGRLVWEEITVPSRSDFADFEAFDRERLEPIGKRALGSLAVIKLNGGLGTSMHLDQPKSLIPVLDGRNALQIISDQVGYLRQRYQVDVPLLLMNSFNTQQASLAQLEAIGWRNDGLPLDFVQNKFPRIDVGRDAPFADASQASAWAPPGHGDIYRSLSLSGVLDALLERGVRWAFVSNADNLAATVDLALLGHLEDQGADFAMEVTDKTMADVKGGTLVNYRGGLSLLERAQVADEHVGQFESVETFTVFNTNSLWCRLDAVKAKLESNTLDLPLIVNRKQVDGNAVVQLETAMGAAIGCFDRTVGLRVPRSRFAPVKTTNDLLAVRSDAYLLDQGHGLRPHPGRDVTLGPPVIDLEPQYFSAFSEFEKRVRVVPGLRQCRSLTVRGDVHFEEAQDLVGDVTLTDA